MTNNEFGTLVHAAAERAYFADEGTSYERVLGDAEALSLLDDRDICCPSCRHADIRFPGDTAICTVCYRWHNFEHGPISNAFAAELARMPMSIEDICESFAKAGDSMTLFDVQAW